MKTSGLWIFLFLSGALWGDSEPPKIFNQADLKSGQSNIIKQAFISNGSSRSHAAGFQIRSSVAEPVIGKLSSFDQSLLFNSGYIKPNTDLIFINSLEQE